jgi:hypothetical protein
MISIVSPIQVYQAVAVAGEQMAILGAESTQIQHGEA